MSNATASPERTELLNLISQVKSRVADKVENGVDFPIPQFILIGKQSVGKSRLVESFAGEQFNFVSGTLGSRRPTVLEFRNNPSLKTPRWQILEARSHHWQTLPISEVMVVVGRAHESLGATVSREPVYVRVESPYCVDMQIVDLPGFRDFALDTSKQDLADQIETLVGAFMRDPRNVMLCVEEAGDAANMATLSRCKRVDPDYKRTILIRNKLDKYYKDLTAENVNDWLRGYGDLPEHLEKFSLTLPHWKEGTPPPKSFIDLRQDNAEEDVAELRSKGAEDVFLKKVGFNSFTAFMEKKIESVFHSALGPSLVKLKELRDAYQGKLDRVTQEFKDTDPDNLVHAVRAAGQSFSHALNHVLHGQVPSQVNRMTLEEELLSFDMYISIHSDDSFDPLPTLDFKNLYDYITYLGEEARIPGFDLPLNGGAQYTRLKHECEVYFRFSEICVEVSKRDVLQARGISIGQVSWQDVVLKLLANEGQPQVRRKVNYVAKRIEWFFAQQKENIIEFMDTIKGSPDEHLYSKLFTQRVQLIKENQMARDLLFAKFDSYLSNQRALFVELFNNTLQSTFQYPWALIKASSWTLSDLDRMVLGETETDDEETSNDRTPTGRVDTIPGGSKPGVVSSASVSPRVSVGSKSNAPQISNNFSKNGSKNVSKNATKTAVPPDSHSDQFFHHTVDGIPSFEDTVYRIPKEMSHRATIEQLLQAMVNEIPIDNDHVETAVEKVQALMITVFRAIRNLICDQLELFSDSFFLLPMSRHLEVQMMDVVLSDSDMARFSGAREGKLEELKKVDEFLQNVLWSTNEIELFLKRRVVKAL